MPAIIPETGADRPKTDADMTYPKNKNIDKAIRHKLRKKDVYETDMHKIYNCIVGKTDEKLQNKAESDTTLQAFNTGRYHIGYFIILKKLWFSKQYEQHPIRSLCMETRKLHNDIWHFNEKTTDYLARLRNAQKVNKACNGSLISRGVQEPAMNILYFTVSEALSDNEKK